MDTSKPTTDLVTAAATSPDLHLRRAAFDALVARYQHVVYGMALNATGDAALAEDIAQEAFTLAWQKLPALREPDAFAGWLRRLTLTQCRRARRASRALPLEETADAHAPEPALQAEQQELRQQVRQAVAALPAHQRLVTRLFYLEQCSQADISEFLELPLTTVKKRLHDARTRLRQEMLDIMETPPHPSPDLRRRVAAAIAALHDAPREKVEAILMEADPPLLNELMRQGHFQRFSGKTRHAIQLAHGAAQAHGSNVIEPEHLLLGLLRAEPPDAGLGRDLATAAGLNPAVVEATLVDGDSYGPVTHSPRSMAVLQTAAREAKEIGMRLGAPCDIGSEHLLLGLLHDEAIAALVAPLTLTLAGARLQVMATTMAR